MYEDVFEWILEAFDELNAMEDLADDLETIKFQVRIIQNHRCSLFFKFFWRGTWGCEKLKGGGGSSFCVLLHFYDQIFQSLLRRYMRFAIKKQGWAHLQIILQLKNNKSDYLSQQLIVLIIWIFSGGHDNEVHGRLGQVPSGHRRGQFLLIYSFDFQTCVYLIICFW